MWARLQYDRWNEEVQAAAAKQNETEEMSEIKEVKMGEEPSERTESDQNKENEGGIREDYKTLMIVNNTIYLVAK